VALSLLYRLVRCLFGLLAVLVRSDLSKDVELLVLRHENRVLRRQLSGRLRWGHGDRLWLAALSGLVCRRRWAEVFPVTGRGAADHHYLAEDAADDAICERVNGTLRRELLDRISIVGERHLALVLREYVAHYNLQRPQAAPVPAAAAPGYGGRACRDVADLRSVRRKRVVTGVVNEYHHAA